MFILKIENIYDLLLSKKWMHKVRVVKNHHVVIFTLKNKNEMKRTIKEKKVESLKINKKLLKDSLMNEWKTAIAKNELTRLTCYEAYQKQDHQFYKVNR